MSISITQLEYVLAVGQTQNFRKASARCHITQPTLSVQIQKLEEVLGAPLFDRSRSPVVPTQIGKKVIDQARVVLTEMERLREIVTDQQTSLTGELNVGVIPTVAPYLLPLFLKSLTEKHGELRFNIRELTTENCLAALDREEIDVALLATRESSGRYQQDKLGDEELFLYMNRHHHYWKKKKLTLHELNAKEFWLLEEGHCLRDEVIHQCRFKKLDRDQQVSLNIGNLEAIRALIKTQGGYTLIPKLATLQFGKEELRYLRPLDGTRPSRELMVTVRRRTLKKRAIAALSEEIKKALAQL